MGHDVFISHSSLDKLAADAVCHGLEAKGVRCWIAPRDQVAGRPYGEQITAAIKSAEVMVLIFSDNVNNSQAVLNEINVAAGSNVTIVPFRLAAVDFSSELHFYLGRMHWLDAFPPPLDAHLELLTETVQRNLKRPPAGATDGAASAPAAAPIVVPTPPLPPPVGMAPPHPPPAAPRHWVRPGLIVAGLLGALFLVLLIVIAWPRPPDPVRDQAANTLMQSVANAIAKNADDNDNDDDDDRRAVNRTIPAPKPPPDDDR